MPKWTSWDGVSVTDYPLNSVFYNDCGKEMSRIGPICHELYHFIGLPDLYDSDTGNGAGNFAIMVRYIADAGPKHHPGIPYRSLARTVSWSIHLTYPFPNISFQ